MSATVHFYLRTDRPLKDGSALIYLLFTVNRNTKLRISTGKRIPLRKEKSKLTLNEIIQLSSDKREELYYWDKSKGKALNGAGNSEKINSYLIDERKRANDIILKYELMNKPLTLELFKKEYLKPQGALNFHDYFIKELDNHRAHKLSVETIKSYKSIVTKINNYKPNLMLNEIDHKFLIGYENYMLKPVIEGGCGNTKRTVANNMKVLRTLIIIAIKNGDYHKEYYPFKDYTVKDSSKELTTRDYLEPDEVLKLEELYNKYIEPDKHIGQLSVLEWKEREDNDIITPGEYLCLKRFLFCCYTGLRFRDMINLNIENHIHSKWIQKPSGGEYIQKFFIELDMHKTNVPVVIPLIDKALEIIDIGKTGKVFEPITNQKINKHLKEIQKKSKINKRLSFHVARHSFATISYIHGMPEKVLQKVLGHRNRKYTDVYTHLSQDRLFFEMEKLNKGMNENESLVNQIEKETNEALQLLPQLQKLDKEKLQKLSEFLKLIVLS